MEAFAWSARRARTWETGETFAPDAGFDLDRYLGEGFGIFRGGPVEEVTLRFSPSVARYLKERNPAVTIVGADPEGSIYSGGYPGSYQVEGIGEDFLPRSFDSRC